MDFSNSNKFNSRPIERVMDNAFTKMRSLVEADVIVGSPIVTADGVSIIPINRVSMGFVTGGGEYSDKYAISNNSYPFAGGSGGGMTVSPICFLVNNGISVQVININEKTTQDKIFEMVPDAIGKIIGGILKNGKKK